jgi:ankyrin repeat protein
LEEDVRMRIQSRYLGGLVAALLIGVAGTAALAQNRTDTRVVNAAQKQDKTALTSLLQNGAYVGGTQPDGTTALHWAVNWGDLDSAELLMLFGADLNAKNDYGTTPLLLACEKGNAAMVEKLLARGANPNVASPAGESPLMHCARTGSVAAVKSLLQRRADPNAKDNEEQQTALMWAVAQKHADVAKALIDGGADIHAKSRGGFTPMMFAARVGAIEAGDVLLAAKSDVNEVGPGGMTPLVLASASGQSAFAIHILDKGANANAKDQHGATAMHYAILKGLTSLNGTSRANYSLYLYRPALKDLVTALLKHKADPNARLMTSASLTGRYDAGVRRDSESAAGATPYLLAAAAPDAEMMRMLKDAGADPLVKSNSGLNAVMVAAGLSRGQDFNDDERRASAEAVKVAVEHGNDVNGVDDQGLTALHGAALNGADATAQFLIEKGAKLDVRDKYQQTPLSVAAGHCLPWIPYGEELCEVIRPTTRDLLLKAGATPLTTAGYFTAPTEFTDAYRVNQALRGELVPPQPPAANQQK